MIFSKPSSVAFGLMLWFLAVPSVGQAGAFDCFFPSYVARPVPSPVAVTPTTVQRISWMPVVANQGACDPCSQQVSLVPVTERRWTYSRIPKTTFKPVTTCDPCMGCPVTTYRPSTTFSLLPWLHRETYTVYNPAPVLSASCNPCATTACNPCGGGSSSSYSGGISDCSTCATGSTLSGTISSPGSSMQSQSDPGYPSQKTFPDDQGSGHQDNYPSMEEQGTGNDRQPEPDNAIPKSSSTKLPELYGPRGRTAARPIEFPGDVRTVSWELSAAAASPSQPASKPKLDVSGWHAVTD